MSQLHYNISLLSNVGSAYQTKLNRLKIYTVFDLLTYAPRRYENSIKQSSVQDLIAGDKARIIGKISDVHIQSGRTKILRVTVADQTGFLVLKFFRFYPSQINQFQIDKIISAYGTIGQFGNCFEIIHPEYSFPTDEAAAVSSPCTVYPLSEGLTQKRLIFFIETAFKILDLERTTENLPVEILHRFRLQAFWPSLYFIHYPDEATDFEQLNHFNHPAQQRLIFEELLAHRLAVKQTDLTELTAKAISIDADKLYNFVKSLPFILTAGQQSVLQEIFTDLQKTRPMQRLLQGDVGSGKSIIAFISAFVVIHAGQQTVLMAPTEILAEQLYQKAHELLAEFGISVLALMGKMSAKHKKAAYAEIESGRAKFIVGTQALIQEKVKFHDVGLIIIDEQHRFGVGQRLQLHQKGQNLTGIRMPHQLVMSATPIPRTLAMTLYADLDISNIYHLPAGRQSIETALIADTRRQEIIQRLKKSCAEGGQVYWICPLIEESEILELESAAQHFELLWRELPELNIALLHGRMTAIEKVTVMNKFKQGEVQILVATTVVEVGVDVPNASIIIIENPERMGLSQLHQLRGRVGRGHKQSFCILLYHPPLSEGSMARLMTLRHSQDGFALAEKDLELRGAGDFFGTRQTGGMGFRFASLSRDHKVLKAVYEAAEIMQQKYPVESKELIAKWFAGKLDFVKV